MRLTCLALALSLAACTVQSRPAPAGPSERRDDRGDRAFDRNSQWDKLGERWVNGRIDRDVIPVQRRERYSRIRIVVEHSALELHDVVIHFGNGEVFSPGTRLIFGQGSTSREIDLPGGGRAQVEVWGLGGRPT